MLQYSVVEKKKTGKSVTAAQSKSKYISNSTAGHSVHEFSAWNKQLLFKADYEIVFQGSVTSLAYNCFLSKIEISPYKCTMSTKIDYTYV